MFLFSQGKPLPVVQMKKHVFPYFTGESFSSGVNEETRVSLFHRENLSNGVNEETRVSAILEIQIRL